jgi:O-antigen ligase
MPDIAKPRHHRADRMARLGSADTRFWVLIGLLGIVFLTGGGARSDILSLVILRPASFLAVGYALALRPTGIQRHGSMPIAILLALVGLMALQLVPLPPDLWTRLPGRGLIAAIENDAGIGHGWRPLSLSPSRTLNSLFSLGVPLAASLLLADVGRKRHDGIAWALLAAGSASAFLGLMQMIGPTHGPLYTYRIANFGTPTGLFANRNHQAVFLACLFPLLAHGLIRLRDPESAQRRPMLLALLLAAAILFLALIVATGSRAGSVLMLTAILGSAALWLAARRRGTRHDRAPIDRFILPAVLLAAAGLLALLFVNSRTPGIDRIFHESLTDEFRWQILPILWALAKAYFPFGSGFGSFYLVYQVAEPHALLQESYLNQAHNDLLQFVIEGGLPALLLLIGALTWFVRAGWRCWFHFCRAADEGAQRLPMGPFAWLALAVLLAAGLVDYPLRTPALMAVAVILAHLVARSASSRSSTAEAEGD